MPTPLTLFAGLFSTLLVAFASAAPVVAQDQPEREDVNAGPHLYREFCASCHGPAGKGDGPLASTLPRRATDLTTLARRNAGRFPRPEVLAVLEADRPLAAHAEAMPNWREMFSRLERGNERAVRARMEALVAHLETLQVRP